MNDTTLKIKTYIITHSEMVSTLGPFRRFLTKLFKIPERKGSFYDVTVALKEIPYPAPSLTFDYLIDSYNTVWDITEVNEEKKTLKIKNVDPIYGFNKKNMYTLKLVA